MKKFVSLFVMVTFLFNVTCALAAGTINENEKSPDAQYEIAMKYMEGKEVGKNYVQAYNWFKKAALQGHAQAQYELAGLCASGAGNVHQSDKEAFKWYEKAATQGVGEAKYYLGNNDAALSLFQEYVSQVSSNIGNRYAEAYYFMGEIISFLMD